MNLKICSCLFYCFWTQCPEAERKFVIECGMDFMYLSAEEMKSVRLENIWNVLYLLV